MDSVLTILKTGGKLISAGIGRPRTRSPVRVVMRIYLRGHAG
jgi:hypothetical protein